jgi:hypothetical protein
MHSSRILGRPNSDTLYFTSAVKPVMSGTTSVETDFEAPKSKKRSVAKNLPRVYVGNLLVGVHQDLAAQLQCLVKDSCNISISTKDIVVVGPNENQKTCHAFVTCASNKEVDLVCSALHQRSFQGQKLVAQKERKPKKTNNKEQQSKQSNKYLGSTFGNKGPVFGAYSWSKPHKPQRDPSPALPPSSDADPVMDGISSIISEELNAAYATGDQDDIINTTLASLAAVSLLAPIVIDDDLQENKEDSPTTTNFLVENPGSQMDEVTSLDDFKSSCMKPLSQLLEDYGEEDPDWQSMQPQLTIIETADQQEGALESGITSTINNEPSAFLNRLGRHGKAPIHVEFVSFGYSHGAPAAVRNGWHYGQPLPVFECRDLPCVPPHLAWRDGVSGFVQRSLLKESEIRQVADRIKEQTFDALVVAINEGGHGYVAPLQMKIYVGSENGRHRSVVVCEQAAKWLRQLLRVNENDRITAPVSVGTFHRDVDRTKKAAKENDKASRKKGDMDSDW